MKKILIILVVLAGIAVATCPDRDDHAQAILEKLQKDATTDANGNEKKGMEKIASRIAAGYSSFLANYKLEVKSNFLYSVGTMTINGKKQQVTFGLYKHVSVNLPKDSK